MVKKVKKKKAAVAPAGEVAEEKPAGSKKLKKKKLKEEKATPEPEVGKKRKAEEVADTSTGEAKPQPKNPRVLFVGGINRNQETEFVRTKFEKHGKIEELVYPYNSHNRPMGFAFITYVTEEDARKALSDDGTDFAGKKISVKIKEGRPPTPKLTKDKPKPAPKTEEEAGGGDGAKRKDKKYKGKDSKTKAVERKEAAKEQKEPKEEKNEEQEEEQKEEKAEGKKTGTGKKKKKKKGAGT